MRALMSRMVAALAVAWGLCSLPAGAFFHLMQIEQVVGGVAGDTTKQAIQLRMRAPLMGDVQNARLVVRDAEGLNPIVVCDMSSPVVNQHLGDRVLIASTGFAEVTVPPAVPDFTMTNLIPASYLAAGTLTYESDSGFVQWRLSWGGKGYTGPCNMSVANDPDGNACPPYAGGIPYLGGGSLYFDGAANEPGNSSLADYALNALKATFSNNPGENFTITAEIPPQACCDGSGTCTELTPADCLKSGGMPLGPGTDCKSASCPTEACCFADGSCQDLFRDDCLKAIGSPMGFGSECKSTKCTAVNERACCIPDGGCLNMPVSTCAALGGFADPFGRNCCDVSCSVACCFVDGSCAQIDMYDCIKYGGSPGAPGSSCATANCPDKSVACCFTNGDCEQFSSTLECLKYGGVSHGIGSRCGEVNCPVYTVGCCLPDGSCSEFEGEFAEADCLKFDGTPRGPGTNCAESCPVTGVPCCLPGGFCVIRATAQQCLDDGGIPGPEGVSCFEFSCPEPQRGCCLGGGTCMDLPLEDCLKMGGTPSNQPCAAEGAGCDYACCIPTGCLETNTLFDCFTTHQGLQATQGQTCPQSVCTTGNFACCLPSGSCINTTLPNCGSLGGRGRLGSCSGVTCPQPTACCFSDGTCDLLLADDCIEQGGTPNPSPFCASDGRGIPVCPQIRACCLPDGGCVDMLTTDCAAQGGVPNPELLCSDGFPDRGSFCPRLEACCFPDGHCEDLTPFGCTFRGGTPAGSGSFCPGTRGEFPAMCEQPRACCFSDGHCENILPGLCAQSGGTPGQIGSTCATTNCPQPLGACCTPDGVCSQTTEADCDEIKGQWHGQFSFCVPDRSGTPVLCPEPSVPCCIPEGFCVEVALADCLAFEGIPGEVGESCCDRICTLPPVPCCFPKGFCEHYAAEDCIKKGGRPGPLGSTCLSYDCPPGNDLCADAIEVFDGETFFNNFNAGTDGPLEVLACGEYDYPDQRAGHERGGRYLGCDVWFRYVATCNGVITVDTCGSKFDTVIAIYDGARCPTFPSALICNDQAVQCCLFDDSNDRGGGCYSDQSFVRFPAQKGQPFLIRVGGYYCDQGEGRLGISCEPSLPSNDSCEFATPVTEGVYTFDNTYATLDGDPYPSCFDLAARERGGFKGDFFFDKDLWFCYTPSCSGEAWVATCGSQFDTILVAHEGCTCPHFGKGYELACDDQGCGDASLIRFEVLGGHQYLIRVGGYYGSTGFGVLTIACKPSSAASGACCTPTGDCEQLSAVLCVSMGGYYFGDFTDCGKAFCEQPEACCFPNGECHHYTAGGCIALGGSPQRGEFCGKFECPTPPPNDNCANAIEITDGKYFYSNRGATTDGPREPIQCGDESINPRKQPEADRGAEFGPFRLMASDIWYCYTATCDGAAFVNTCGSDYDTVLAAYDAGAGAACVCPTGASAIACNDDHQGDLCPSSLDSAIIFPVISGRRYLIRVGGYNGRQGDGVLSISCQPGITGDFCFSPIQVTEGQYAFDTTGATTEPFTFNNDCFEEDYARAPKKAAARGQNGCDIWFCYTPSCTGTAYVNTCGADYDSVLAAYDGCDCPVNEDSIACNDDTCGLSSFISFPVTANQQYMIRLGGFDCDTGSGVLSIICVDSKTPDEACCLPDGGCQNYPPAVCSSIPGAVPDGPGSFCFDGKGGTLCPSPRACCLPDGGCTHITPTGCAALGGFSQPEGVFCGKFDCSAPRACCLPGGSCVELNPAVCAGQGGTPQDPGTLCDGFKCPSSEPGACCLPNGQCTDVADSGACAGMGGQWQGASTTCATTECPQPPTALCCRVDGQGLRCDEVAPGECAGPGQTSTDDCALCACLVADVNRDGRVGLPDVAVLIQQWDFEVTPYAPGDINGDGTINLTDLAFIILAWDTMCPVP